MRGSIAVLVLIGLLAACGDAATAPTGSPEAPSVTDRATNAPDETTGPDAEPTDSESEEPPATEDPIASDDPTPIDDDPFLGQVVATTVDRLRLRMEPGTDAPSAGSLARGTELFVLGGPAEASGYAWYQVVRLGGSDAATGWVAAASPQGTPWLEAAEATCPELPATFEDLAGLAPGLRLACFADSPITVAARLAACNCEIETGALDPPWFGVMRAAGVPLMLADPSSEGPVGLADGLPLVVDPAGETPDPLPLDETVEITGTFDHPAGRSCTSAAGDGESEPEVSCRFAFVVSAIETGTP